MHAVFIFPLKRERIVRNSKVAATRDCDFFHGAMNLRCAVEKVPIEFTQRVDAVQLERSGFLSIQPAADSCITSAPNGSHRQFIPENFSAGTTRCDRKPTHVRPRYPAADCCSDELVLPGQRRVSGCL